MIVSSKKTKKSGSKMPMLVKVLIILSLAVLVVPALIKAGKKVIQWFKDRKAKKKVNQPDSKPVILPDTTA